MDETVERLEHMTALLNRAVGLAEARDEQVKCLERDNAQLRSRVASLEGERLFCVIGWLDPAGLPWRVAVTDSETVATMVEQGEQVTVLRGPTTYSAAVNAAWAVEQEIASRSGSA